MLIVAEEWGWITVRVEDTCDGLLINEDDAKEWGLASDVPYRGYFLPDGRYRICLAASLSQPAKDEREGGGL